MTNQFDTLGRTASVGQGHLTIHSDEQEHDYKAPLGATGYNPGLKPGG